MPPKTDPYATPVHRRIDIILFAVVSAIVAILLSTSAHAQVGINPSDSTLITYFNFNDSNLISDAGQPSTISFNSSRLNASFVPGTTTNALSGDPAGNALELTSISEKGGKNFQFTVSTTGFTDLSLSFATKGTGFTNGTLAYSVNGGETFTTSSIVFSVPQVTTFPTTAVTLNLSSLSSIIGNQASVTFQIQFNNAAPGSFVDFDNIQLTAKPTPVPEPATVGAGVMGVLGLCWHQRRRLGRARQLLSFSRKL